MDKQKGKMKFWRIINDDDHEYSWKSFSWSAVGSGDSELQQMEELQIKGYIGVLKVS